jgi:di/tricarboxylate transporter
MEIALVLGLLVVAIALFTWEKISVDVVTLMLLIILILCGILTPAEAFAGFSSDFIIILASIFVVSGAMQETGVLDRIGAALVKVAAGLRHGALMAFIMIIVGTVSAFMNNTTVTALFVGPVSGMARKMNVSPSKLLMPMAFASIMGGTCTLIGTSTNVAVSGFISQQKNIPMLPIGMFEITPVGLVLFAAGILYMFLVGRRFLPDNPEASLTEGYAIREYLSEVVVVDNSPLIGQHISETNLSRLDIRILQLLRDDQPFFPHPYLVIQAGDLLLVEGKVDALLKIRETNGIQIRADMLDDADLLTRNSQLAEALITNGESDLIGKTIKSSDFRKRYGLVVLAVNRAGQTLRDKISHIELRLGDLLLVQGTPDRIRYIRQVHDLAILGEFTPVLFRFKRGMLTVGFFMLAVLIGSLELAPLSVCFLTAAVLTVLTKAMTVEQAYSSIDWRLLILIGGMSAFGLAMEKTGASSFLAGLITDWLSPFGKTAILTGFVLLTILLTQPMSNAAAALVVLPIALETAEALGANPRSFAIGVMLAASISLITPFEPSCILVYGPGRYKFSDFFKTGSVLTLILLVIIVLLVPVFWPL